MAPKRGQGIGPFGRGLLDQPAAEPRARNTPAGLTNVYETKPAPVQGPPALPEAKSSRRREITPRDEDGYVWMMPSPTAWPDVRPDGHRGRPPGPRTQVVGYNKDTRIVRTIFRDGTPWAYYDVPPEIWNQLRRAPSTGRFINSRLNNFDYGPTQFSAPGS